MIFPSPLVRGKFISREQRFLTHVILEETHEHVVAHCTNSGSMQSCLVPNAPVYLSISDNPARKTKYTWEMIQINENWVGINTNVPNKLVYEFLKSKTILELSGYEHIKPEAVFEDSRFDFYAENKQEKCYIEVKNVTLKEGKYALFPDAVTTRGQKHLNGLIAAKKKGFRAIMVYIIQRSDVEIFAPAKNIDLTYAKLMKTALLNGVELFPIQVKVTPIEIKFDKRIPLEL